MMMKIIGVTPENIWFLVPNFTAASSLKRKVACCALISLFLRACINIPPHTPTEKKKMVKGFHVLLSFLTPESEGRA